MTKVLIIHHEGNINNNPCLNGLLHILSERGYHVDVLAPKLEFCSQVVPKPGRAILPNRPSDDGAIDLILWSYKDSRSVDDYLKSEFQGYDLFVGIDRAIHEAAFLGRRFHKPFGLISFEILFRHEVGEEIKRQEIAACRGLSFAIVQDESRALQLCRENRIPMSKCHYLPVAGRGAFPILSKATKPRLFHKEFSLPKDAKVALMMGSVAKWSGVAGLINSMAKWPSDWHLVIHNRYGMNEAILGLKEQVRTLPNIHFSSTAFDFPTEMRDFIQSADVGIAFYLPEADQGPYTGDNIRHIGFASGKTSAYLQHGIPVAFSNLGPLASLIEAHRIGIVVDDPGEFSPAELTWDQETGDRCIDFFEEFLNLDKSIKPLLSQLEDLDLFAHERCSEVATEFRKEQEALYASNDFVALLDAFHRFAGHLGHENPVFLNDLGVVEYLCGNHDRARSEFTRALILEPNYLEAKENLAKLMSS